MLDKLLEGLQQDKTNWKKVRDSFKILNIPAKTVLLREGEIAQNLYFIKKGCLRLWFNNDGKDITFQFFFENQAVSSFESFLEQKTSMLNLESIEKTELVFLSKKDFDNLLSTYPRVKDGFYEVMLKRLSNYAKLFLSRIKDNPQKRYKELLESSPEIIKRIPQHYIASYLGITPISLSRIRNKK
jgi:CRP-like cAMP-binding protein